MEEIMGTRLFTLVSPFFFQEFRSSEDQEFTP